MKIIVLKDRIHCSRCKTFISKGGMTALAKLTTVIDADKNDNAAVWSKWLKKCSPYILAVKGKPKVINYPFIFVVDDSEKKIISAFSAYDKGLLDPAKLTAHIKKVCPECCEGCSDASTDEPVLYKECPTCKGAGKIAVALACLLTLWWAGCVSTYGKFKPPATVENPNPAEIAVYRFAILYPFEVADVSYDKFRMGNYKTSGGAAELVPLFDATGKVIGSVIGTAAKAAVVP